MNILKKLKDSIIKDVCESCKCEEHPLGCPYDHGIETELIKDLSSVNKKGQKYSNQTSDPE